MNEKRKLTPSLPSLDAESVTVVDNEARRQLIAAAARAKENTGRLMTELTEASRRVHRERLTPAIQARNAARAREASAEELLAAETSISRHFSTIIGIRQLVSLLQEGQMPAEMVTQLSQPGAIERLCLSDDEK